MNTLFLLPELFLLISMLFLSLFSVFYRSIELNNPCTWGFVRGTMYVVGFLFIQTTIIMLYLLLCDFQIVNFIVLLLGLCCVLISLDYFRAERFIVFEYYILIMIVLLGLMFLITATNFIFLYLSLELQSLSIYVLSTIQSRSAYSSEAGLKYFILGSFASCLYLFGVSLVYGSSGLINFEEISNFVLVNPPGDIMLFGFVLICSAILFNIGSFPYHWWIPDIYEGVPTVVTAFIAITPNLAVTTVLITLIYNVFPLWENLLVIFSVFSMFIATFSAIHQKNINRFIAYSSVGHVGYFFVGLCCMTLEGVQGLFLYLLVYLLTSISIWCFVLTVRSVYFTELSGLSSKNPLLALSLAISLFSIGGVPPLAGFCAKAFVFFSAIESALNLVAFVGVLTSVVAAFYYIRIINILYFDALNINTSTNQQPIFVGRENSIVLALSQLFIALFICYPNLFLILSYTLSIVYI